jgi:ABC-type multidrug transport system ATPase subunit
MSAHEIEPSSTFLTLAAGLRSVPPARADGDRPAVLKLLGLKRLQVGPVDCEVGPGECISIMGPSGAGKSVLLRMLADLDPHEGDAALDGVAASSMAAPDWRSQVTYVPADSGWWSTRVADHFAAGTDFSRLEEVGIAPAAAAWPVSRLSTGEKQRLALMRAITPRTRALLLDEPTSGLDAGNIGRVEALLRHVLGRGIAIVLVTHDPAQALRLARRHFTLSQGRLVEDAA